MMDERGARRGSWRARMSSTVRVPVRANLIEPLRRTLGWLVRLRDARGAIVCPEHRVEHSGSNAGVIVLASELLRLDPERDERWLLEAAVLQARRLCLNLVREGTSACHTFRPGRHDPFNCSNSVIDGGAAADALSHLVRVCGDRLDAADRERFTAAALLHARSYLRYAVLDKGIPAQRAWGLTGLAGAWALEHDEALESAAIEAIGALEGIQNADGSYPYHPLEWGAAHAGASDVSSFYQSRPTAFLIHALESLGRDVKSRMFGAPIARGLDFLAALYAPDGTKCGLVEAKPWYFGANYEVASHPFDIYALARGAELFDRERLGRTALAAYRAWVSHLAADGRPTDHQPAPGRRSSYQCPVFWAGHAAWIARALPALERAAQRVEPATVSSRAVEIALTWFPNAALGRLEDGRVIAWVRGARPAVNVHHGSPHGAGLVRVFDKALGRELLEREPLARTNEAEWSASAGRFDIGRGWRSSRDELRFSLWLARVAWRRRRYAECFAGPWRVFQRGLLGFSSSAASSAFDLAPEVELGPDRIVLRSRLAWRDGTPVTGSVLERSFSLEGQALLVDECIQAPGAARRPAYRVPRTASRVERSESSVRYRLGGEA